MLYYIHGYQSSPQSAKGRLFKQTLQAIPIAYREGKPEDLIIKNCLCRIAEVIQDDDNVVLIGSSLGGFLAASTALDHSNVKKLILLNPAIIPPTVNIHDDSVPRRILNDMIDKRLFDQRITADITILRGTEDEVVPHEWVIQFALAQEATVIFFHDDHSFTKNLNHLPQIIQRILR